MVCDAPAEGIYARQQAYPPALQRAIQEYTSITIHQVEIEWDRHMPRAVNDPWIKGKEVVVRFAVMPDGSIDTPIVTVASGRRSYDDHALDAIKAGEPFPPLPEGVKRPLPVCIHFRYNKGLDKKSDTIDLWPGPSKTEPHKQPADGAGSSSGAQPK
jgi:TonB family protein